MEILLTMVLLPLLHRIPHHHLVDLITIAVIQDQARAHPSSSSQSCESNKGMSVGAIVGIILGSVFLFFIALLAVVFCIRKKKRKDGGAIVFQGSRSAGTTDSRFPFVFHLCS